MQMAERGERQVFEPRAGLAETQEGPASRVDEHARASVDPDEIARRRPFRVDARAARSEDLQRDASPSADLRPRVRSGGDARG